MSSEIFLSVIRRCTVNSVGVRISLPGEYAYRLGRETNTRMSAITIIRCQSVELVYKIGALCFLCRSVGGRCRGYRHQNNRLSNELGPVVYEGVAHVADDGRLVLSLEFWGGGQR